MRQGCNHIVTAIGAYAQPQNRNEFKQQVAHVCQLYKEAQQLRMQGVRIVSTDEMTGIQAIERAYPTEAMTSREICQSPLPNFAILPVGLPQQNCGW